MKRHLLALLVLAAASAANLSCQVNDYCLNCATGGGDGGPGGDGQDGDIDAPDIDPDADGGGCTNTGPEVCDGNDNDCDGNVDEGPLPTIGESCSSPPALNSGQGECAGGVKQCVAGAVVCSKSPSPEQCDLKDNNCNGLTDEGDPGGGAQCGTNEGECVAGVNRCINGQITCTGQVTGSPETCNNRDDDCDGRFDENIPNLGPCVAGVDGPAQGNTGACNLGTRACIGGVVTCPTVQPMPAPVPPLDLAVFPTFERCDAIDQDCDGNPTNGYNLTADPQNCGTCGNVCNLPRAFEGCAPAPGMPGGARCTVLACETGYHNADGNDANGCEVGPCTITGPEICDGHDNDCDGLVDMADPSMIVPTNFCNSQGACSTMTTLTCSPPAGNPIGTLAWKCNYNNPNVQKDAMGNIIPETRCDSDIVAGVFADNDCDGLIDEGQPNLGDACDNGALGTCRRDGVFTCNATNATTRLGPAVCNAAAAPPAGVETCNGLDDNCNGIVDDGAATGNLGGQEWVAIGNGRQIMKYEASRPDALTTNSLETHACSTAGRQPWTNVTYPQAAAACASIGARLCTEGEWHRTCSVVPSQTYPIAAAANVTVEAEDYSSIVAGTTQAFTPDYTAGFSGVSAMQAGPNIGTSNSTATALTSSPRLDYQFNFAAAGTYNVCIRKYSVTSSDNLASVGINATPGTGSMVNFAEGSNGAWGWVMTSSTISVTAGVRTVSIYMREDGIKIDRVHLTTAGNCNGAAAVIGAGNRWSYQANANTYQPNTCNGEDLDADLPPADPGDQDDILPSGSLPMCHANNGANDTFDMSGNVKEWTLRRRPGQNPLRGGASNNLADGISCNLNFTLADDTFFFPNVGFRCCR